MKTVYLFSDFNEYPNFEDMQEAQANCRLELAKEVGNHNIKRLKTEVNKVLNKHQVKVSITFREI